MSVYAATAASFAEEAQILVQIALNIGEYRRQNSREDFHRALEAMDMEEREVSLYWDLIESDVSVSSVDPNTINWDNIKCNSDLAYRLGISLNNKEVPRNLLLYRLMELHFPDFFEVEVTGTTHMGGKEGKGNPPGKRRVIFPRQPVGAAANGEIGAMSVHRVLRGLEPSQFPQRVLKAARPLQSALGSELGLEFAQLLIRCKMEIPELKTALQLDRILRAGMEGETVTLVGTFCPDYAYEVTGDPHLPYRYTFDGLGDGVGLVARQFVRIVPAISDFLADLEIDHRIILGIGDFEADSNEVLEQVGLDREEFLRRCQSSLDKFADSVSSDLPLELEMFDGKRKDGRLQEYIKFSFEEMTAGRFGYMTELHDNVQRVLDRIPRQYRMFYQRWYGREMKDLEVSRIVYQQGAEYAAVARIYIEDFGNNTIMLAGDRPQMHLFNAFFSKQMPSLCAKRAY